MELPRQFMLKIQRLYTPPLSYIQPSTDRFRLANLQKKKFTFARQFALWRGCTYEPHEWRVAVEMLNFLTKKKV